MWLTRSDDYDLPMNWDQDSKIDPITTNTVTQAAGLDLLVA